MKKISFICLAIIIAVSSCRNPKSDSVDQENNKWKFDKFSTEKIVHIDNDSTKPGMKVELEFNYPSAYRNDTILGYVQNVFLEAFGGKDFINLKPKDAFDKLEKEYTEQAISYCQDASEDGIDISYYYQTISTAIADTSNTDHYITARTELHQYTGGAHGMYYITFYNANTHNGDLITEDKLFKPGSKDTLTKILKELLEAKANSGKEDAITLLEPESIAPNGNFYFTKTGVVYVYNTYEVAPYSDGLVEVEIPYDRVKDIITPDYSFLFETSK
jgi:hypothetical protein